jgi:hypothetical protein
MEEEGGKEYRWEAGYEKTWEAIQEDKEGLLDYSVQVGNCLSVGLGLYHFSADLQILFIVL